MGGVWAVEGQRWPWKGSGKWKVRDGCGRGLGSGRSEIAVGRGLGSGRSKMAVGGVWVMEGRWDFFFPPPEFFGACFRAGE